jgi:hypothetical protein
MSGSMYLVRGEDLVEMTEQPYELEVHLQRWIAQHPPLLAGDQINSDNPRRWLLVSREFAVVSEEGGGGRWSLDHLFLDQDAVPTLVEVKRSSDTRIRREVVGQMLDYAANGTKYWPIEAIRAQFIANCEKQGSDADARIVDFLGLDADVEAFWQAAKTNLEAGRLRLIFVADEIPPELRRVVEFLNGQMDKTEVLALEVKQFVGQGLTTLVPRIVGQTVATQDKKPGGARSPRQWDEESFLEELNMTRAPIPEVGRKILAWLATKPVQLVWGQGGKQGSVYPILQHEGKGYESFSLWTDGGLGLRFGRMWDNPPFTDKVMQSALMRRLSAIPGLNLHPDKSSESRRISRLEDETALGAFFDAFDWYFAQIIANNTGADTTM